MAVIAMSLQFGHYGLRKKTNWWDNFKKGLNNSMGYLLSHCRSRYLISLMFPTPVGSAREIKYLAEKTDRRKSGWKKDGIDSEPNRPAELPDGVAYGTAPIVALQLELRACP
jgi:hypothetical protein